MNMNHMTDTAYQACGYLSRAYRMDEEIRTRMERIRALRATADMIGGCGAREAVGGGRQTDRVQERVMRIMEAEEELDREIDALIDVKAEIGSAIARVGDVTKRLLLEKRYLLYLPWKAIAADLGYTLRWTYAIHAEALEEVWRGLVQAA